MSDPVFLITGASSGIGAATARAAAGAGYRVVRAARSTDRLHELASELGGKESRGHLLLTGSLAGRRALPGSLYSATKFAVTAMGEAARRELNDTGIRVTLIERARWTRRSSRNQAKAGSKPTMSRAR